MKSVEAEIRKRDFGLGYQNKHNVSEGQFYLFIYVVNCDRSSVNFCVCACVFAVSWH